MRVDGLIATTLVLLAAACSSEKSTSESGVATDSGAAGVADAPASWPGSDESDRLESVETMAGAAQAFLGSLAAPLRTRIQFSLEHEERSDWSNLPHALHVREGVSFGELNEEQMDLGWALIRLSLSAAGLQRSREIVQLEQLLWEDGDMNAFPGNYFFTFFDEPLVDSPWGWQLDGHHLALNFSVVGSEVTMAPSLWGTSPKVWPTGEHEGLARQR